MTVTVLQRIASKQQIGLLLVPAIKGTVYINTHCNYSQPLLTKLYNKNIDGHPYTFTVSFLKIPHLTGRLGLWLGLGSGPHVVGW